MSDFPQDQIAPHPFLSCSAGTPRHRHLVKVVAATVVGIAMMSLLVVLDYIVWPPKPDAPRTPFALSPAQITIIQQFFAEIADPPGPAQIERIAAANRPEHGRKLVCGYIVPHADAAGAAKTIFIGNLFIRDASSIFQLTKAVSDDANRGAARKICSALGARID